MAKKEKVKKEKKVKVCKVCGGTGFNAETERQCAECDGSGK